jgi:hypothetical protein
MPNPPPLHKPENPLECTSTVRLLHYGGPSPNSQTVFVCEIQVSENFHKSHLKQLVAWICVKSFLAEHEAGLF